MDTLKSLNGGGSFRWSLPCDVNSSLMPARDYQFLEEARKSKAMKNKDFTSIDMEAMESQSLLDHDVLQQNFQETQEVTIVPRFTTKATLQISATPVDDPLSLDLDNVGDRKTYDCETITTKGSQSKCSIYIHEKKFDENGNAVPQNQKIKKKKSQTDKNVVVLNAESVEGHRSDIINDVDKLTEFISGEKERESSKSKSNIHKSKHLHKQHTSEDGSRSKKQRTHSSKSKESTRSELKKSNSLGEISTSTLEDFAFSSVTTTDETKVVLRITKERIDRPKERRSWGNVEAPSFDILSSNASTENLEQAENWVVTKPKKKSKKRRNSVSSGGGRRQNSTSESAEARRPANRAPSPEFRGAKSVPYSEKSNDSSDADSVHSLPIDGLNVAPISYADIAKNNEKSKEKKSVTDKPEKQSPKEKSPSYKSDNENKIVVPPINLKMSPPNVNNPKSFPAIPSEAKNPPVDVSCPKDFPTIQAEPKSLPPDVSNLKTFPAIPIELKVSPPDVKSHKNFPVISPEIAKNGPLENVNVQKPLPAIPLDVTSPKSFPGLPSEQSVRNNLIRKFSNPRNFSSVSADIHNNNTNVKPAAAPAFDKTNIKNNIVVSDKVARNTSPGDNNKSAVNNNVKSGEVGYFRVNVKVSACVLQNNIQNDLSIIHSKEKDSIQFNAQMLPPNIPDVQTIEKMHFMNRPSPPAVPPTIPPPVECSLSVNTDAEPVPVPDRPGSGSTHRISDCDSSERTISGDFDMGPVDNEDAPWEEELPPVIILSGGGGSKEVPGLVFGFDINEQLLNEDICESFVARYVVPEVYSQHSHNHDKIVNFIGSAWEAIISQSNGKVPFYEGDS